MRFGNFLFPESRVPDQDGRVIDETLAEARLSDTLGMEVLWLAEHHFDGNCAYVDPVSFAGTIAGRTERIQIGFAVAQVSLHHPIRLAEQMSLLDNITHGRLIVGLGRGTAHNIYEYTGYGIDPAEAQARLLEAEEVLIGAWTTENFRHEGQFWQLSLPLLRPRPFTRPHPHLIRASSGEESLRQLGAEGRPFMMNVQSTANIRRRAALYRDAARGAGLDEGAIDGLLAKSWAWRNVFVADSRAKAERIALPAFSEQAAHRAAMRERVYAEQGLRLRHEKAPADRNRPEDALILGTPDEVADRIDEIDEIGIGGLILSFRLGPMAHEQAMESLRLFMTEVAPRFAGGEGPQADASPGV